jgi:hypothetical protein
MAAAARAELFDRELFSLAFFVLAGRIVAAFAAVALKSNQVSHRMISSTESDQFYMSGSQS